jgi:NTP pyrophosphatase (non-canonical NTP hydrolase)
MEFDEYQEASARTDVRPNPTDVAFPLLGMAGEVGELVTAYKKRMREDGNTDWSEEQVREELGDLLWYVATLARTVGLSLNDIAETNLRKSALAFGAPLPPAVDYDASFPESQRLPRQFKAVFSTGRDGRISFTIDGRTVGDPLDDNAYEEDFYRFHDALHLANLAVLGWSPMVRAALGRKRKANALVDRVEDGARAIFIEEAALALTFSEGAESDFFASSVVHWELIKTLTRMTRHLEVSNQPPAAWQSAIAQGFAAWRELRTHGGGILLGDLDKRCLEFVAAEVGGGQE